MVRDEERPAASRVLRFREYAWEGVESRAYKDPNDRWRGVVRHPLIGEREGTPFHVRYFEIEAGGFSSFEHHEHQHVVVPIRGRGEVRLGDRWTEVSFGDVIYVAGNEPHQFRSVGDAPFGFICVVDAGRDRPVPL